MQKIVPNIWFDSQAQEAAEFYASIFPQGRVSRIEHYPQTAEEGLADFQQDSAGKVLVAEFELAGFSFVGINGGPASRPNPSISFMLNFDPSADEAAEGHLDELWAALSDGGEALMELGEYPFSRKYGWVKDRYGVTWQLILTNPAGEPRPFILPSLMFNTPVVNRAREAIDTWTGIFADSGIGMIAEHPEQAGLADKGAVMFGEFELAGQWFTAMDSPVEHAFGFDEGISLAVMCEDQAEIDRYWAALSTVPEAEQCGWCKDQFGVSWQITPANMTQLLQRPGGYATMMSQHKIVIDEY